MDTSKTLDELMALRWHLLEKNLAPAVFKDLEAIDQTINLLIRLESDATSPAEKSHNDGPHPGGVIDVVLAVIDLHGGRATNKQMLEFFTEKGIFVHDWKDKDARLAQILGVESRRPNARISRVKNHRGLWKRNEPKSAHFAQN
jgi:hypothetical protein